MASEAKHTPGPWVAVIDTSDYMRNPYKPTNRPHAHRVVSLCDYIIGPPSEQPSGELVDGWHHNVQANALLIAAAPELLDACRKALYALKGREHDQFLRDAIAKATGAAS